jgi:hypothetical protein
MANSLTIEERIAHFLRVAEDRGATQAERDTASSQAEKLMLKHAIDRAMLAGVGEQKKEEIIIGRVQVFGGGGTYSYHSMAGMVAVVNAMGLQGFQEDFSFLKVKHGQKPYKNICFAGYESDVHDAENIVNSLLLQAMIAMKSWWKNLDEPTKSYLGRQGGYHARCEFIRNFGGGAARRIRDEREAETVATEGAALVLLDRSKEVSDWTDVNLSLKKKKTRRLGSNFGRVEGYTAGLDANTSRSKGVSGSRSIGQ